SDSRQFRWLCSRLVIERGEGGRDLGSLVVPRVGSLVETGDVWEPYRLLDPAGGVVGPVATYLRDLQAVGRPARTRRSYAHDLLRWFRFVWAISCPWDQATRAEARDFSRWIQARFGRGVGGCERGDGQGKPWT